MKQFCAFQRLLEYFILDIPEDEDQEVLTAFDSAEIDLTTIQALYLPVHPEHLAYVGTQFPMYHFNTQVVGNESWQDLDILNRRNIGPHMNGLAIIAGNYSVNIKDKIFLSKTRLSISWLVATCCKSRNERS